MSDQEQPELQSESQPSISKAVVLGLGLGALLAAAAAWFFFANRATNFAPTAATKSEPIEKTVQALWQPQIAPPDFQPEQKGISAYSSEIIAAIELSPQELKQFIGRLKG